MLIYKSYKTLLFSLLGLKTNYRIRIKTGNLDNAGTDSKVYIKLCGEHIKTGITFKIACSFSETDGMMFCLRDGFM